MSAEAAPPAGRTEAMRPDQVARLQRSLAQLGGDGSERFYRRLFSIHPTLRPLFGGDIRQQARKFFEAMQALVGLLQDPPAFRAYCAQLGGSHAGYGVREADYDQVGATWITLLSERLGPEFDEELERLWLDAYGRVAEAMLAGGGGAPRNEG